MGEKDWVMQGPISIVALKGRLRLGKKGGGSISFLD